MLFIFCKKNPDVYITKVDKDKKKANNSPYKLFGEVLRVVIVSAVMVHPLGSYIPNFNRFYCCAQSYPKLASCRPTIRALPHTQHSLAVVCM